MRAGCVQQPKPRTTQAFTACFSHVVNTFRRTPRAHLLKLKSNLARFTLNAPAFVRRVRTGVSAARAADRMPVSTKRRIAYRKVRRPHRPGAAEVILRPPGFNELPSHPMP
jgi:hypothetical protein